jgi:hypothetical protein
MASSISKETHVQGTKTIEAIFFLSKTRFPLFSLKFFLKTISRTHHNLHLPHLPHRKIYEHRRKIHQLAGNFIFSGEKCRFRRVPKRSDLNESCNFGTGFYFSIRIRAGFSKLNQKQPKSNTNRFANKSKEMKRSSDTSWSFQFEVLRESFSFVLDSVLPSSFLASNSILAFALCLNVCVVKENENGCVGDGL